jgi:hypothetical protein
MTALVVAEPRVTGEVVGNGFFLEANPFRRASMRYIEAPEAETLQDMVDVAAAGLPRSYRDHLQVWLGEHRIDSRYWHVTRPKTEATVYIRVRPQGGRGGKNILRAVIMIAIIAVAVFFLGPAAFAAGGWLGLSLGAAAAAAASAAAVAAVSLVAMLALNALIPPPGLTNQIDNKDPRYSLTGSQNRYAPYAPIPRVFGKVKIFPLLAARPFTEVVGKHQYLRMLLLVGWGPIQVTDIRIGNSPITAFRNVEYEIHEGGPSGWAGNDPITLYNRRVTEQDLSLELIYTVPAAFQTTAANTVEIACDITFPIGMIEYEDDGDRDSRVVRHKFEYRVAGSGGGWTNAPLIDDDEIRVEAGGVMRSTGKTPEVVRHTARWTVPEGQYEVRVTRQTVAGLNPSPDGDAELDRSFWTVLRSFSTDEPVVQEGVCLIAIRMQATDQLNGVPSTISCIAESYLPTTVNGTTWNYEITQSPAWAYADVLRRRGGVEFLPDSRIDVAGIMSWATACAAAPPTGTDLDRWTFNGVIEGGSVFEALRHIASIGRAGYTLKDGKHSVVRDIVQSTPVQHITPANSWGYSGSRTFADLPHALRIEFVNAEADYVVDERVVYADGYDDTNATKFEVMSMLGATSPELVFREGRYHLAVGTLRPEEHRISMDVENLRCTLGDRVQLSHDVISVGKGFGRIVSLATSGANTTGFVLDGEVEFENNETYALRVREADGSTSLRTVTANGGTFNKLGLSEFNGGYMPNPPGYAGGDVLTTGQAAPDGTSNAVKLVPSTVLGLHGGYGGNTFTGENTLSIYAKAAGYKRLGFRVWDGSLYQMRVTFDVEAGTVVLLEAGTAGMEEVEGYPGWWRVWITGSSGVLMGIHGIEVLNDSSTVQTAYSGDGTSGMYLFGLQCVEGDQPGYYVKTTTSSGAYGGFTDTLACSAETTAGGPAGGDLFMFGESGIESLPAMVKRIEPGDDLSAVLTLVPYDAAIYTADTGSIPAFNSYLEGDFDRTAPEPPIVTLRSGESAKDVLSDGTVVHRLAVDIASPPSSRITIAGWEVQYRLNLDENWSPVGLLWPASTTTVFITPVTVGAAYEVRVRSKGTNGLYSDWEQPADHTVTGNTVPPQPPTGGAVFAGPGYNFVYWINPATADLAGVEVWAHTSNTFGSATKLATTLVAHYTHSGVPMGSTRYYWLRSINKDGVVGTEVALGAVLAPTTDEGSGDNYVYDGSFKMTTASPSITNSWDSAGGFTRVSL